MSMVVNDFEKLRTEYEPCSNFVDIYAILKDGATREVDGYTLQDGHLFLGRKLCIQEPPCLKIACRWSSWVLWEWEDHWSRWVPVLLVSLKRDVAKHVGRCHTCQLAIQQKQNTGLYTPLPVPNCPWQDISVYFVLGLPKPQRKHDSILLVVDHFFKMTHFFLALKLPTLPEWLRYFLMMSLSCMVYWKP